MRSDRESPLRFEPEPAPGASGQVDPKPQGKTARERRAHTDTGQPPGEHGPAPPVGEHGRLRFEDEPQGAASATSGQHDPKPGGGKYRQQSKQGKRSERLHHEDEAPPRENSGGASGPKDKKAAREGKRFEKSGQRAEKTGAKLPFTQTATEYMSMRSRCCKRTMMDGYKAERDSLTPKLDSLKTTIAEAERESGNVHEFMELITKYIDIQELDSAIVHELIEKIVVHQSYKDDDGQRCQQIDIFYRFVGQV